MIARIRKSIEDKDQGFTLIELLVVIIIIGILAAIAIPVFLNQRKKAVEASLKSDLRTAATLMETDFVDTNDYGSVTAAAAVAAADYSADNVVTIASGGHVARSASTSPRRVRWTTTSTTTRPRAVCSRAPASRSRTTGQGRHPTRGAGPGCVRAAWPTPILRSALHVGADPCRSQRDRVPSTSEREDQLCGPGETRARGGNPAMKDSP